MKIDWIAAVVGIVFVFSIGFASGYNTMDAKLDECVDTADTRYDYFGPTEAGKAVAFAQCVRPKIYRLAR